MTNDEFVDAVNHQSENPTLNFSGDPVEDSSDPVVVVTHPNLSHSIYDVREVVWHDGRLEIRVGVR